MATFGDPNWNSVALTMMFNRCTREEAEIALGLRQPKVKPTLAPETVIETERKK